MRRLHLCWFLCILACGSEQAAEAVVEARPGEPLPGLSAAEAGQFEAGHALFNRAFTPEEGLGPLFNQTRCASCHDLPTSGGHGAEPVTKVSRFDPASGCSLLEEEGGDLLQALVVPALFDAGVMPERIPESATAVVELRPPPLYGLGLVEAVEEASIRDGADPLDADGDGVSGRLATALEGAVGRFGAKGQHATLRGFIASALNGELGLTTTGHLSEQLLNGQALPEGSDPATDPEVDEAQVRLLVAYVRFLAPTEVRWPEESRVGASVAQGERVFESIGCANCHTPTMVTAPHESPALDRKRFRIYSDLLLHDMGPELADICAPGVTPSEWMTTRLVGLGRRTEFMHNRRAQGLEAAILLHGGEGAQSSEAYRGLDTVSREQLMDFLRSL